MFVCICEIFKFMLCPHFMYTHIHVRLTCIKFESHLSCDASLLVSFPFQPMAFLGRVTMSKIFNIGEATPTKIIVYAYYINLYLHEFFSQFHLIIFFDHHRFNGCYIMVGANGTVLEYFTLRINFC